MIQGTLKDLCKIKTSLFYIEKWMKMNRNDQHFPICSNSESPNNHSSQQNLESDFY